MLGTETVGGSVLVSKNPAPKSAAPAQSAAPDLKKKLHDKHHELKQKRQAYHYDWNQETLRDVAGSEAVTVVITVDAGGKLLFAECCRSTTRFVGGEEQKVLQAATERRVRIPERGACLFRGNMWHAGDSYEGEHWRMHFYLLRRQGHEAAEFRNSPGTTDLGLHAVEGVAEYQAALQRAAPADFDAEQFTAQTVGSELQRRKWGKWKS